MRKKRRKKKKKTSKKKKTQTYHCSKKKQIGGKRVEQWSSLRTKEKKFPSQKRGKKGGA